MKKILVILGFAFVVISACMIYLVRSGVSLRSAPIIRPSPISADGYNLSHGVIYRLSPEFQQADYVLWGVLPKNAIIEQNLKYLREEYERVFNRPVDIIENASEASAQQIKDCKNPCWLYLPQGMANELTANEFLEKTIRPLNKNFVNITWFFFTKPEPVSDFCIHEKRLTLDCLKVLAIEEAQRKMKPGPQYFFMKKYNDRDFFLFYQESPQT